MSDKTRDLESLLLEQAERDHDDEMDFSRFMTGVVESQERSSKLIVETKETETATRKLQRRRRESPMGKIRFGT